MKYHVHLAQTVTETATVEIEADSDTDAEQQVLDMLDGDIDPKITWKLADIEQDAEIIGIEEVSNAPQVA